MKSNYKEDLTIDRYQLEYEWERQAQLYVKWAEKHADAMFERDRLKEYLELLKAEIYMRIVEKHAELDQKKPTEAMLNNLVLQSTDYKNANSEFLKAKRDTEYLYGAKEGMQHKKTALEHLSRLFISSYYAEPNISGEIKKQSFENTDTAIRKSLKRSRKLNPTRLNRKSGR